MTNRLKHLLRLLLLIVAVVLSLGAGELVARALKLAPPFRRITVSYEDHESIYQRSSNPILGYELKPNYYNPNPDQQFTCRSINSHGQRDIERTVGRQPGVRRVLLLGDSIVESTEVADVDDVMHRQLEKLYPDGKTEILNFGVGGYCTLAEVELLRVKGLKFDPDIVIVVFFHNDFANFNWSVVETLAADKAPSRVFRELFSRSHLFRATLVRSGWTPSGMRDDPVVRNKSAIGANNVAQGLALLRQLADRHGFRPGVAVWPVFEDDRIHDKGFMPDGTTLVVEDLARAVGIPCFRLAPVFRRHDAATTSNKGPRQTYTMGDGWHANETGSTVAALALKEVVEAVSSDEESVLPSIRPFSEAALAAAEVFARIPNAHWKDVSDALAAMARDHSTASHPEKAIQHMQDAVRLRPDDVELVSELAVMYANSGEWQAALSEFRKAVALAPGTPEHHVRLATALSKLGRNEEALPIYREALRLNPEDAQLHSNLGRVLRALGRPGEAIGHYQQTVQLKPDIADAHYNLGNALVALGRAGEAIECYRQAVRIDPNHVGAHNNLGAMYRQTGRLAEAIKHFEQTVRLKPDSALAQQNLRETRAMVGAENRLPKD
ncbi:MAG: tetratricopeptide repeat protein [Verrucomicrobia bacterium]|nr:tetratricopeptide repeat protein [Verrucomicrobiota bacterium]MBT7067669.1 tetratricopeptide repeat protein [Verrucomicrobiota bacterium]MBT7700134.1 tetratricopeptide repeat protein [Verrucomicrobiota bacterium]